MFKKLTLFTALFLFAFLSVKAQQISFGIKAGYESESDKYSFPMVEEEFKHSSSGFYVGGLLNVPLYEAFSIQPELLYSMTFDEGYSSKILSLPVLAKYDIPNTQASLLTGPQASYLLKNESNGYVKSLSFNWSLGASYKIMDNVSVDLQYAFGINNLISDEYTTDEYSEDYNSKLTSNFLRIGVGYSF